MMKGNEERKKVKKKNQNTLLSLTELSLSSYFNMIVQKVVLDIFLKCQAY